MLAPLISPNGNNNEREAVKFRVPLDATVKGSLPETKTVREEITIFHATFENDCAASTPVKYAHDSRSFSEKSDLRCSYYLFIFCKTGLMAMMSGP